MTGLILQQLGATPEQIDRERERIRSEFSGGPMTLAPFSGISNGRDAAEQPGKDRGNG